jgi:Holliday junction resolvase
MRESSIERAVCEHARKRGAIAMKLAGPSQKGQPDRMFLHNGKVVFLEFKAPGKKPTALQEKWLRDLKAQKFIAMVCDDTDAGKWLIDQVLFNA